MEDKLIVILIPIGYSRTRMDRDGYRLMDRFITGRIDYPVGDGVGHVLKSDAIPRESNVAWISRWLSGPGDGRGWRTARKINCPV